MGGPGFQFEFVTAPSIVNGSVYIILSNTGQVDTFAGITLTQASAVPQQVSFEMPAGATQDASFSISAETKAPNWWWLSIFVGTDQIIPWVTVSDTANVELVSYLPGDFAVYSLANGGRTRLW